MAGGLVEPLEEPQVEDMLLSRRGEQVFVYLGRSSGVFGISRKWKIGIAHRMLFSQQV